MTYETSRTNPERIKQISNLVSAYVSNNHVAPIDLPALIASVHAALSGLAGDEVSVATKEEAAERPTAAQIRKSVTPEALISFLDGKSYKTLKRHLTKHGLDPRSYRERFGLPTDYPMVAASYSETRSSLAKSLGLGQPGGRSTRQEKAGQAPKRQRKAA